MPLENTGSKENILEEMKLKMEIHLSTYPCSQCLFSHGVHSRVQKVCGRSFLCILEKFKNEIKKNQLFSNAKKKKAGKDDLNLYFIQLKIDMLFCFLLSFS